VILANISKKIGSVAGNILRQKYNKDYGGLRLKRKGKGMHKKNLLVVKIRKEENLQKFVGSPFKINLSIFFIFIKRTIKFIIEN